MMRRSYLSAMFIGLMAAAFLWSPLSLFAQEPIKISFWHAMSARRMVAVNKIIDGFNQAHPGIKVEPQFTGRYEEVLAKAIAAVKAGTPPHLVQIYEVGTQTMLDSGAIVPVFELFKPGEVDWGDVIGPIHDYYAVDEKLYSMPFNSSTSILYYNKDLFRKAGLDPNKPPSTWDEMEKVGTQLVNRGVVPNALSFGWPDWQFEQMHTLHNQFYANQQNGRARRATEVLINGPFGVKVVGRWVALARKNIFVYGGEEYKANDAFLAEQVAMLFQSTSSVGSITRAAKFEVGTSFLPRFEGYERGNSVIGGATIWVMKGHSPQEYEAIKEFLKWMIRPEVTAQWHKDTGYFPATNSAVKLLLDEGWFAENPNHLTAFLQILTGVKTPASQGVRLGPFVAIRKAFRTALEKAVQGTLSPQATLDEAAREANRLLKDYNELYQ